MKIVNLSVAYTWLCPECGRRNFAQGIDPKDLTKEELEAARAALGIEPWEAGELITIPAQVVCRKCNIAFGTKEE